MTPTHVEIGETQVDLLFDGVLDESRDNLIHDGGAEALADALAGFGDRPLQIDVNCFLLRGPRGIEMVDAGAGAGRNPTLGRAWAALEASGVAPDAVDRIYLTHLHYDHALGLLDGDAAHFPRAEVIVPATDLDFYTDAEVRARHPVAWHPAFDDAARVATAYAGRLRAVPFGPVMAGVDLMPIPGHTLGQGAYAFTAEGATLLLFGDLLHFEKEQAADPDLGLVYDHDSATAAQTRRTVLRRAAAEGWIVGGGHVHGFGRVARTGRGFSIVPV